MITDKMIQLIRQGYETKADYSRPELKAELDSIEWSRSSKKGLSALKDYASYLEYELPPLPPIEALIPELPYTLGDIIFDEF